ncbi:MAG TPA: N-acetylmuramoyl-L-alanine amidase [Actinobacteria bacterium]|nr:N-acetylmuramoyl-L-alanine amidase [Actinomycetota bacterium]
MVGLFSLKNNRFRLFAIIGIVALILISASFTAYGYFKSKNAPESSTTLDAPALVGRALVKAKKTAEEQGLKIEIDRWVESKVYPKNYIVTQKPLPGHPIEKGAKITIKVSGGASYAENGHKYDGVAFAEDVKPLPIPPIQPANKMEGKVVVIDPGHQRKANPDREPVGPGATTTKPKVQSGTSGIDSKTPEYKITLAIAEKLKLRLESYGVEVIMTRESHDVDISNRQRADIANRNKADLFVRIHADGATDPEMHGISTLYPAQNSCTAPICEKSLKAARSVQHSVVKTTWGKDNGTVAREDISGFNWSKVPVILVETGFMSNPKEDALLNDPGYQGKLADGIAKGIADYLRDVS